MKKQPGIIRFVILAALLVVLNILSSALYYRFDLTKENRFTLSDATVNLIRNLDDRVFIEVYLEGDFPAGFKNLRGATRDMLSEFRSHAGSVIEFSFINPAASDNPAENKKIINQLVSKGLHPVNLKVKGGDGYSEKLIFPGALVKFSGREIPVHLLENQLGSGPQEALNKSVALLEYKFANAILKVSQERKQTIAFSKGHGELEGAEVADIMKTLSSLFEVVTVDLTQQVFIPGDIEVVIIPKPGKPFSEEDKFKLDQYIMNGGRVFWLLDALGASIDSLQDAQAFLAVDNRLNLDDQLFRYGVRINADLVQDLHCNRIPVVVGMLGDAPQTQLYPWVYYPVISAGSSHPVVKSLDLIMLRFTGTIDTVGAKGVSKTVLLSTSEYSRALPAPVRVHLSAAREEQKKERFRNGHLPVAVLLEGRFSSVFANRFAPSDLGTLDSLSGKKFRSRSVPTRMIVTADGDIIRNDLGSKGAIYPLGFYKYTDQTFANKDFILNGTEYLCDQSGLIASRSKEVKLRLLDKNRMESGMNWRMFNLFAPLMVIVLPGILFNWWRRRRYSS